MGGKIERALVVAMLAVSLLVIGACVGFAMARSSITTDCDTSNATVVGHRLYWCYRYNLDSRDGK